MIGKKAVSCIAVLCALVFSAFAAADASAAQKAVTCTSTAMNKTFGDAHCLNAGGAFGHEPIADNTVTTITGTNGKTASNTTLSRVSKLRGQLAGVITEIQCTGVAGHGTLTNKAAPTAHVEGEGIIKYTGCSVTAPPGKGCVVTGGAVTTANLFATTEGRAAGTLHFKPAVGVTFATIPIAGCAGGSPPNNNYLATGELTAQVSGATTTATHAQTTLDEELEFGGVEAGLDGALTISMAEGSTPTITAGQAIALT